MCPKKSSSTLLHNAVKQGDVETVEKLLKKRDCVLALGSVSDKNSPLHLAHLLRHGEIADRLLAHIKLTRSYDQNPKNQYGLSHLHIACARGNAEAVMNFEFAGANVHDIISQDSPVHAGYSCLQLACESKSLDTIAIIVRVTNLLHSCITDKKAYLSYIIDRSDFHRAAIKIHHEKSYFEDGKKILMSTMQKACFNGDIETVETLLEKGKDVDEVMSRKAKVCPLYKLLHFAVEADKNRQKIVEIILAYDGDTSWKDGFCMTPLHLAMYNDNPRDSKNSAHNHFEKDCTLAILYKATKDKESNPMDPFGLTYFHIAVACNDMEMVVKLMAKGESDCKPILPNSKNFSMYTPLHFAVKYGNEDIAKLLIEQGTDVNVNETEDLLATPLQVAFKYGEHKMIDLLLAKGANPKVLAYGERTTLHLLTEHYGDYEDKKPGLLGFVEKLVECGVNINGKDSKGCTALHNACYEFNKKVDIVEELLRHGADVNMRNKEGETAIYAIISDKPHSDYNVYFKIYLHLQKLKDFGVQVDEKNERIALRIMEKKEEWRKTTDWDFIEKLTNAEELMLKHQERISEIQQLKNDILDGKVSLYDYVKMDAERAAEYSENERIKTVMTDKAFENLFENYGYMISVTYKKSLCWIQSHELTKKKNTQGTSTPSVSKIPEKKSDETSMPSTVPEINENPMPSNITLLSAVKRGNVQWVQKLLQKGASTNDVDKAGNSPLHLALLLQNSDIADLILACMSNEHNSVDLKNRNSLTHLHVAAARGNAAVVRKLIHAGANPLNAVDDDSPLFPGYTALQFACDSKSLETLRVLSTPTTVFFSLRYKDVKNWRESCGEIILFTFRLLRDRDKNSIHYINDFNMACCNGTSPDVEAYLQRGDASVNTPMNPQTQYTPRYTPLHFTVESKTQCRQKVELLLKFGADVTSKNGFAMTPLHLAMYNNEAYEDGTVELLYQLAKTDETNSPMDVCGLTYFHVAIALNDLSQVKRMLFQGVVDVNGYVLPNLRNFAMFYPLHFAVKYGHAEMTRVLIERGGDVNANDHDPRLTTPLQLAITCGSITVIDVLLEQNVNAKVLQASDNATVIHLLTERFRDINDQTVDGLDQRDDLVRLVEKLVKLGVDIDAKDSNGDAALHLACRSWHNCSELVAWLLVAGADVNVVNNKGMTPLELAYLCRPSVKNFDDLMMVYHHVQMLKDLGLAIDSKNDKFCEIVMSSREKWKTMLDEEGYGDLEMKKKKKKRLREIETLKKEMLTDKVSLYDYLRMSPDQAVVYAKNEKIEKIVDADEPRDLYEVYGYLFLTVYWKSLKWLEKQQGNAKKTTGKKTHRGKRKRP